MAKLMRINLCCTLLLFLDVFKCDFDKTLRTDSEDSTMQVNLTYPINLYGKSYKVLVVHTSGVLSFEPDVHFKRQLTYKKFRRHAMIVPHFSKDSFIKETTVWVREEDSILQQASSNIRRNFLEYQDFQAREFVAVTWKRMSPHSNKSIETVDAILTSDGHRTFAEFYYQQSKQLSSEATTSQTAGAMLAGFSAGDRVRHLILHLSDTRDGFNYLTTNSNVGPGGKWLFMIGDDSKLNFHAQQADSRIWFQNDGVFVHDLNECDLANQCHVKALCRNFQPGYECTCPEYHVGNGRVCMSKDSRLYITGGLSGRLNGADIPASDVSAHVNLLKGDISVSVFPMKKSIGEKLILLPFLWSIAGWMFAKADGGALNGFEVTGARLTMTSVVVFDSGAELFSKQVYEGFDPASGDLIMNTVIDGSFPEFGEVKSLHMTDFVETYRQEMPGSLSATAYQSLVLDGRRQNLTIVRYIQYNPVHDLKNWQDVAVPVRIAHHKFSPLFGIQFRFAATVSDRRHTSNLDGDDSKSQEDQGNKVGIPKEAFTITTKASSEGQADSLQSDFKEATAPPEQADSELEVVTVHAKLVSAITDLAWPSIENVSKYLDASEGFPSATMTYVSEVRSFFTTTQLAAETNQAATVDSGKISHTTPNNAFSSPNHATRTLTSWADVTEAGSNQPTSSEAGLQRISEETSSPFTTQSVRFTHSTNFGEETTDELDPAYKQTPATDEVTYSKDEQKAEVTYSKASAEDNMKIQHPTTASKIITYTQHTYHASAESSLMAMTRNVQDLESSENPNIVVLTTSDLLLTETDTGSSHVHVRTIDTSASDGQQAIQTTDAYEQGAPTSFLPIFTNSNTATTVRPKLNTMEKSTLLLDEAEGILPSTTPYHKATLVLASTSAEVKDGGTAELLSSTTMLNKDGSLRATLPATMATETQDGTTEGSRTFSTEFKAQITSLTTASYNTTTATTSPFNSTSASFISTELIDSPKQANRSHSTVDEFVDDNSSENDLCKGVVCDENAACTGKQGNGEYFACVCRSGYVGDGTHCEVDESCQCQEHEVCFTDGQDEKKCDCALGFQQRGDYCEDIDECVELSKQCDEHALCVNTIGSFECICSDGFLNVNRSRCEDRNECTAIERPCGNKATCRNTLGSYECMCPVGFKLALNALDCIDTCYRCMNGGTCIGDEECACQDGFSGSYCQYRWNEFLVLAQGGSIKRLGIHQDATDFGYLHSSFYHDLVSVDFDCKEKRVFWADATQGAIGSAAYNGTDVKELIGGLGSPEGIAVDWFGRNIFWTDSMHRSINVGDIRGKYRKSLFMERIYNPRGIVCHQYLGRLFWTDWNRSSPKLESSSMDGSDRKDFVKSDKLSLPNGLAINYANDELCWADSGLGQIACISLDGFRAVRILVHQSPYPFSLAFHRGIMFWTDWSKRDIQLQDLSARKEMEALKPGPIYDGRVYDIKSVVSSCPLKANPCAIDNGGCEYLCLMKNSVERTCSLPDLLSKTREDNN